MRSKLIERVSRSPFIKNALTSVTGSTISQIIPLLTAPVLSRIYDPEDYGKLGIYMGIAMILGTASNFQYSNALIIPKEEEEFRALMKLCLRNSFLTFVISGFLILLIFNPLASLLDAESIRYYFLLLPFSMFLIGIQNSFTGFANRRKYYKDLARNRILSVLLTVLFSISIGYYFGHWSGLLIGYLVGQIVNSIALYFRLKPKIASDFFSGVSQQNLLEVRRKYSSFPKFSMTSDMLNNFTYQIPVFLLNIFVGPSTVGAYNMCNRLLALPSTFISVAVGEVFKQKASEDLHTQGSCRPIYLKTFKTLSVISLIPFISILLFGPQLFSFFLGSKWEVAGEYARLLSPIFLLRFINSPLSFIIYLFGKLKVDLFGTIYLNVTSFLVLFFSLQYLSVHQSLLLFSLNFCTIYLFMIGYSYNLSKRKNAI